MLEVLVRNINRGVDSFGVFETAPVFLANELPPITLPRQPMRLAIGLYGNTDFFTLKGIIEVILEALAIKGVYFSPAQRDGLHPGRTAEVGFGTDVVGVMGEVHPDVLDNFDIEERIYIAELDLDMLLDNGTLDRTYVALPKFPAVQRDIAITVPKYVLARDIENVIKKSGGKLIEDVKLFDVYEGSQIPEGYKSVAYSIVYRAPDRTLTDQEVDKLQERIIKALKEQIGAQLRG
jgi:phenylalanyl-tRNA synthetase beta chain